VALGQPQSNGPLLLDLKLQGQADEVQLAIYTPALVLAARWEVQGSWGPGWAAVVSALPRRLARGLYYLKVTVARGSARTPGRLVKIYILN